MSFVIAAALGVFSLVLHLAGTNRALAPVCRYTVDLCQHPNWPLWAAAGFVILGLLFRLQK